MFNESSLPTSTWEVDILDFGNGVDKRPSDDVILRIKNFEISGSVYEGISFKQISTNSSLIELTKWYHAAFVVENHIGYLYLNGIQIANGSVQMPNNVFRSLNVVGKCDKNLIISIDHIQIWKGALQSEEVKAEFSQG